MSGVPAQPGTGTGDSNAGGARPGPAAGPAAWPLLRLLLAPWAVGKIASLMVPVLYVLATSSAPGLPSAADLRNAFVHWDSISYLDITEHGYPIPPANSRYGWLPGYPLLLKAGSLIFGDAVIAGLVIAGVAELIALYFLARLVLGERDLDSARFSAWALAVWPIAFALSAVYTESPFVAAAAACLYYVRRGDSLRGCLLAAAACSLRVHGLALLVPIVWEGLRHSWGRPNWRLLAVLLVPAPMALYAFYCLQRVGDPLAYVHAQAGLGKVLSWPWVGLDGTWQAVAGPGRVFYTRFIFLGDLLFGLGGGAVCVAAWLYRRFPRYLAAYCTAIWLLSVSYTYWLGAARYELSMFPALIMLSDVTRGHPDVRRLILGFGLVWVSFSAFLFASGRWWA